MFSAVFAKKFVRIFSTFVYKMNFINNEDGLLYTFASNSNDTAFFLLLISIRAKGSMHLLQQLHAGIGNDFPINHAYSTFSVLKCKSCTGMTLFQVRQETKYKAR